MSDQSSNEERTEEPTAKRREKAREDGQIVRSQELSVASIMIGAALFMYLFGSYFLTRIGEIFTRGFVFDRKDIFDSNLLPTTFGSHALESMIVALPFFALTVVITFAAAGLLGGYNLSTKALAPKASKLNPLQGLKRIFGMKALVDLSKAVLKFGLVGSVLYFVVSSNFDALVGLGFSEVKAAMSGAGEMIAKGVLLVTLTLIIAAGIDVPYQVYEHNKKMKMTKQEIKDELKDTEGRPEVKAQIRRKQREMAMALMMDAVGEADVIVVNPQHFAVALSYNPSSAGAPILVAKGVDFLAQGIREKAKEKGVPVFSAPTLARALYFTTDVQEPIPEPLYYAVAQVIAYVFSLNSFNKGAAATDKPNPEVPLNMQYNTDGSLYQL